MTRTKEQKFHEIRQQGIGASEVAAVIGCNPYQTAYDLWEGKTGRSARFTGNKFTRAGHMLESAVAQYFVDETGATLIEGWEDDITIFHPDHDYVFCTPDRLYTLDGKRVLECKTTQKRLDGPMLSWQAQLQYQMGIMGTEGGAIAWLERGLDFGYEQIGFNQGVFDALLNEVGEFWHLYVLSDTPPPPQNSGDIQKLYGMIRGKYGEATEDDYKAYTELVALKKQLKELGKRKGELEEQLKMRIKDAEGLEYHGHTLATWKESVSTRLDTRKVREEQATLYEYYSYEQKTRRFLVK